MNSRSRRMMVLNPKLELMLEYIYVIVGSSIVAIAFNLFLLPNKIASGGVSGISTITNYLLLWEPAFVQLALNVPLFIAGIVLLGRSFGVKSLVGTIVLPAIVFLTRDFEAVTMDPLLGALFGGVGVGLGLGIVFRGKASTGGVDLAAQIINKYTGLTLGTCVALMDGMVVIAAAIVFDIESGMYALIALFVTSKTIDLVQVGLGYSKMAIIITNKEVEMRQGILTVVNRGVTRLAAFGGYTDDERPILMCVVGQTEFTKLKQLVKSIDPSAFVVVTNAYEVLGEGFKRT